MYRKRIVLVGSGFIVLALFCWFLMKHFIGLNLTDSMPIGLYRRVRIAPIHRGDWIAVCLPRRIAAIGMRAHYLLTGRCHHSATMPVLKQVIGLPGDNIILSKTFITVNGIRYLAPYQRYDTHGRKTQRFIHDGSYRARGYWLYGRGNIFYSWDSRYYGAVSHQHILGVYQPVPIDFPITLGKQIGNFLIKVYAVILSNSAFRNQWLALFWHKIFDIPCLRYGFVTTPSQHPIKLSVLENVVTKPYLRQGRDYS